MQSAAIVEKEVSDLRAENEKKKPRRTRVIRQILSEESLTALEASPLAIQPEQVILAPIPSEARTRGLRGIDLLLVLIGLAFD
jgi:hypothetical protein